jgi:hypothetical protein
MPLAGKQLNYGMALALCHHVGFRKGALNTAVALMTAESGRYVEAWHDNLDDQGNVLSTDRGLFQINNHWHGDLLDADAYCAIPNAAYAFGMSDQGEDFTAWAAYNSGAYLKYLPLVLATKATRAVTAYLPWAPTTARC